MKREKGNAGVAILIAIILLLIGMWINQKIDESALWLHVNRDTAESILIRTGLLIIVLVAGAWKDFFLKTLPYLPCALLIIMAPALNYWSLDYINPDYAVNSTPVWYGIKWLQIIVVLLLAGMGFMGQKWINENN